MEVYRCDKVYGDLVFGGLWYVSTEQVDLQM